MAARIQTWEAANLFAGDDDPARASKLLTLQAIKLPDFREKTTEHHPGGSLGALTLGGLGFEALESTFKVIGSDPHLKSHFGIGAGAIRPYTMYGVLRDKQTGRAIERKAVMFGRLVEMSEAEFSRGNPGEQDHKIAEISHYELYEDKQEILYFDFFSSTWRVNGVDRLSDVNAILRV